MATLEQFLREGALGPIYLGMAEAEAVAFLGPPQDSSVGRRPQILKYGGLQLSFMGAAGAADRVLAHVGLYFGPHDEPIPAAAAPTDFKGGPATTLSEVREFLGRVGLMESAAVEGEDAEHLILPSGARITFDGQRLHSIHFAASTPSRSKKQISVAVSQDAWDQLRELARRSKRSVSDLCAEWITQRITGQENAVKAGNGEGP